MFTRVRSWGSLSFWVLVFLLVSAPLALAATGPTSGASAEACTVVCRAVVPATGESGMTVQLTALAQVTDCTGTLTYKWDFGDATPSSSEQNPSHIFQNPGDYTWKVTADVGTTGSSASGTIHISAHQTAHGRTWARHYGTEPTTERSDGRLRATSDQGHILGCYSCPTGCSNPEFLFLKTDSDGTITRQTLFSTAGYEDPTDLQPTPDGGAILSVYSQSFTRAGEGDAWLLKLDALGNCVWQKAYGTGAYDKIRSVIPTADGGYAATGTTTTDLASADYDLWVLKLDAAGAIAWQFKYGGTKGEFGYSIRQTADGGYIVAGETLSFGAGSKDIWVLKLDVAGGITWQSTYGGTQTEFMPTLREISPGGGYFVAATTESSGAGNRDGLLLKLQSNGYPLGWTTAGGFGRDEFHELEITPDGGAVIAGYTDLQDQGSGFGWLLRVDPAGDSSVPLHWQRAIGTQGYDDLYGVAVDADGGFTVSGNTTEFGIDVLALHLDANGNIEGVCPSLWIPAITWQGALGWGTPTTVTPVPAGAVATETQVQGTPYTAEAPIHCGPPCEVSCVATVPATGFVWSATRFDVDVTLTNCMDAPTYFWTFGDGSTATGNKGTHAYHAAGTYDWAVEVMVDGVMCVRTGTIVITESPCTIVCAATVPATGAVLDPIPFAAEPVFTGCTEPATYQWNFGDGSTAEGKSVAHGYLAPGTYQWAVTVTTEGYTCIKAGAIEITGSGCAVGCVATVPATGFVWSATRFDVDVTLWGCTGLPTYFWTFGDGSTATGNKGTHAYLAAGTYDWAVEVMVDGVLCVQTGTIVITESPCTIECAATVPATGFVLSATQFVAEPIFTGCTEPATYHWNFGDGSTAEGKTLAHGYLAAGTYQWAVTVTTEGYTCIKAGAIVITESPCTIECAATVPATGFVLSATQFVAEPIFTGCTEPATYRWNFGDGSTAEGKSLAHGYLAPGTYQWAVTVTTEGYTCIKAGTIVITESPCTITCAATVPATGEVLSPIPFTAEPVFTGCTEPATGEVLSPIPFTAEPVFTGCTEPATYQWGFGDGSSTTGQSATHAYPSPGSYNWYVEVTTQGYSCIKAGTIIITEPLCTVGCTASVPLTAVALAPFSFAGEATLTNCVGAPTFFWTFGDGDSASVDTGTHTYEAPGTYDWVLEVMADGIMCVRTGTVMVGAGLPGDGDGNGVVSIGEVQQSINMFLGIQTPGNGADCSGDGVISIGEVQKVINAFLGLPAACT